MSFNSVYVLIAVDDELRVRECVVVTSPPLAGDLERVLIKTWGGSHVCMASRAVDEVPQNLIDAMLPPEPEPIKPPPGGWIGGGRHG